MEEGNTPKMELWEKARELLVRSGKKKRTAVVELTGEVQKAAAALLDPFVRTFGFADIRPRSS
jgi:hypothetical protein